MKSAKFKHTMALQSGISSTGFAPRSARKQGENREQQRNRARFHKEEEVIKARKLITFKPADPGFQKKARKKVPSTLETIRKVFKPSRIFFTGGTYRKPEAERLAKKNRKIYKKMLKSTHIRGCQAEYRKDVRLAIAYGAGHVHG